MSSLTRVALIYSPTSDDPDTIDVPIDIKGTVGVDFYEMLKTSGKEKWLGTFGPHNWTPKLGAGVYGFATTTGFQIDNSSPNILQVVLASGKDPWPPPPPPPHSWNVSPSTFYGWYAKFLMAAGDAELGGGHTITVVPGPTYAAQKEALHKALGHGDTKKKTVKRSGSKR